MIWDLWFVICDLWFVVYGLSFHFRIIADHAISGRSNPQLFIMGRSPRRKIFIQLKFLRCGSRWREGVYGLLPFTVFHRLHRRLLLFKPFGLLPTFTASPIFHISTLSHFPHFPIHYCPFTPLIPSATTSPDLPLQRVLPAYLLPQWWLLMIRLRLQ